MQTAVAPSTAPTLTAAGTASIASQDPAAAVDFAALLLGQLSGEAAIPVLPAVAADVAGDATTTDPAAAVDPSLLLAAMGLIVEPEKPGIAVATGQPGDDLTRSVKLPMALAGNAPAETVAAAPGQTAGTPLSPADTEAVAVAGDATRSAAAPANFAGLGSKLAESTGSPMETPNPASPVVHAAQSPIAPHAASRGAEALQMSTPVRDPAWAGELGQKVVWIATQERQSAQLTLNPPQMGPIEISLNVKNDQATALFVSSNPEVREAIESAMPRLREMLASVGVELGQTNVSAESFRHARDEGGRQASGSDRGAFASDDDRPATDGGTARLTRSVRGGNGLVDTFA